MNSYNRKVINPLVKRTFLRRDMGQVCLGILTVGSLGVGALTARWHMKSCMKEEYNRVVMSENVSHRLAAPVITSIIPKEGQAMAFGTTAGFAFGTATRALARRYLKRHEVFALRELLHIQRNVYLPVLAAFCAAASYVSIRATDMYYSRHEEKLHHLYRYGLRKSSSF